MIRLGDGSELPEPTLDNINTQLRIVAEMMRPGSPFGRVQQELLKADLMMSYYKLHQAIKEAER